MGGEMTTGAEANEANPRCIQPQCAGARAEKADGPLRVNQWSLARAATKPWTA